MPLKSWVAASLRNLFIEVNYIGIISPKRFNFTRTCSTYLELYVGPY